jgi:hypothetical protein
MLASAKPWRAKTLIAALTIALRRDGRWADLWSSSAIDVPPAVLPPDPDAVE